MKWNALYRLMRLDKPIGTLLLWYPTAWALWLANQGMPPIKLLILFFLGTVLMRSAGCVINDIADRNIDKHVSRTKSRPLTTGELSLEDAIFLMLFLLVGALIILLCLPTSCFIWALMAVLITGIYPFCKRFFSAPQVVLGFAFSMGIPMAYTASGKPLTEITMLLLIINFLWILAYDTMYAMVDREDDSKIGVKSTAILFGRYDRFIISILLGTLHLLWLFLAQYSPLGWYFYPLWFLAVGILIYQQKLLYLCQPELCFRSFLISSYYGAVMWSALL
ncbi:4-hydroxybenzoate octaprenyltransferase [Legionella sp. km772]|uniref:4-hydroxybenzoate octaprenyltransferase n=1 Tax=Legionella sp. km772 TaxID=2498111 RepID=UPI000F8CBFC4|nr:4-hydroxybenzoate octaprenyltransferase [Legionella sp. km772]RUR12177.1 4-hydroxybenzoate octaprenyltransferase [Legionella sp. km772]